MKPINYGKKDYVRGIYAYCQKCKTCIGKGKCQKSKKRLSSCQYPEFHTFRASVIVPNTNGRKRKKRILNTTNLQEAIRLKFSFEQEMKSLGYQFTGIIENRKQPDNPEYLIECMAIYVDFLNNADVDAHKIKNRTQAHIKDVERYFKYFCLALIQNKIDHTIIRVDQINDNIVGMIHNYLLNDLNYKNKTYNKVIGLYRQFLNWLIEKRGYNLNNPFLGVVKRKETIHKTTITKQEFDIFLKAISKENSLVTFSTGERKNYYRDWLILAFKIALETGLRREEFMNLRFSNIKTNENNQSIYIQVENYKVNRIKGSQEEKQIKVIPITSNLNEIIDSLDFSVNQGSNTYLIGPNEKASRKTLISLISKAFTHFWKHSGQNKDVQLHHLRKTYLTALVQHFGNNANIISDHSGIEVLKKHYVNEKVLMEGAKDFKIFG